MAASNLSWSDLSAIVVTIVGVPLVLIGVPIYVLTGGWKRFGLPALERCFRDVPLHDHLEPGDVSFRCHTYRGFLVWVVQQEHIVIAPANDAKCLLSRLLRYNLTWGLLSYGMLLIPVLACGNYVAQMRSIRRQIH